MTELLEFAGDTRSVTNDVEAEKMLHEITEIKTESQRHIEICEKMIVEYQEKIREEKEKTDSKISFRNEMLRGYFEQVPHKKTKTQESYSLPSGKLKLKMKNPELKKDDEKLIEYFENNDLNELVKIKKSPDWAKYKKELKVVNDKVVDENGEILDFIEVIQRDPEFVVEI